MLNDSFKLRYRTLPIATSRSVGFAATVAHNHSEFEIIAIDGGQSEIRVGNESISAKAGDVVFINPMEIHSVTAVKNSDYRHRCICLDCSIIADIALSEALKNETATAVHFIDRSGVHAAAIRSRFNEIFDAAESDSETAKIDVPALTSLLFSYLIKNRLISVSSPKKKSSPFCRRTLDYITENYGKKITSRQVSEALCYDQSYFCRAFKENFGLNFSDYLNMYRISLSRKYLEEGLSIAEISAICGFTSPEYFSKMFKKKYGIPPSKYKKVNTVQK